MSSLDETDSTLARQDSYLSSSSYLAPGNKHATDKIAAELCILAFYLAMNVVCGVPCSIPGAK